LFIILCASSGESFFGIKIFTPRLNKLENLIANLYNKIKIAHFNFFLNLLKII
jgi:hypothetical protein